MFTCDFEYLWHHNSTLPLQFVVHKKSIADYPEIKNEYLSCFKRAQSLLGNKLDGEGIQKLNQTSWRGLFSFSIFCEDEVFSQKERNKYTTRDREHNCLGSWRRKEMYIWPHLQQTWGSIINILYNHTKHLTLICMIINHITLIMNCSILPICWI